MSIGGGHYEIYNNRINNREGDSGRGIQFINAFGNSKIFNNVIINPQFQGIFIHPKEYVSKKKWVMLLLTIPSSTQKCLVSCTILQSQKWMKPIRRTFCKHRTVSRLAL